MELLDQALKFISENLMASASIVAVVIEFAFRLVKTDKPMSIMYGLSKMLKLAGDYLSKAASIAVKLGEFLDKIIPQKLKGE